MPQYRCIRKCHHWVSLAKKATMKIYEPGDIYNAGEEEEVPRHFKKITGSNQKEIEALIAEEDKKRIPAFLAGKKSVKM